MLVILCLRGKVAQPLKPVVVALYFELESRVRFLDYFVAPDGHMIF